MKSTTHHIDRIDHDNDAGIVLSGYRALRLGTSGWNRVLGELVLPAVRLHRFRNTRTRVWREALCVTDCKQPQRSPGHNDQEARR